MCHHALGAKQITAPDAAGRVTEYDRLACPEAAGRVTEYDRLELEAFMSLVLLYLP